MKNKINYLINLYLKFYFNLEYNNEYIKYNDKNIYIEFDKILMFFGLCHREYLKIRNEIDAYEYIKGSHYFNKEIFKEDKKLYLYYTKYNKKTEFDYRKIIYVKVQNENSNLDFIKKHNNVYYSSLYNLELNRNKIIGNINFNDRIYISDYFLNFIEKITK